MSTHHSISHRTAALKEDFEMFDDWMDRYQFLIDMGRELKPMDEDFKSDAYKIHGCQSQVWLQPCREGSVIYFKADSDAQITKGLIAVLLRVFNYAPAADIATADLKFLDDLELMEHLSPTRKNGLNAMIKQIRLYAAALDATPLTD